MAKLETLKAELAYLQTEVEKIYREGRVLCQCWIAQAKPGSKKNKYPRLKSRYPIFNGKKTEYLSIQTDALAEAQAAIDRGKQVKKLNKRIEQVEKAIAKLQKKEAEARRSKKKQAPPVRYAPPELLQHVRQVLGDIDLDPASDAIGQERVQAGLYFTAEIDGLTQPWAGRIWLFPPLPGKPTPWITKLLTDYDAGSISAALLLVKATVANESFQTLLQRFPVCFPSGEIVFLNHAGKPLKGPQQGCAIFYLGPDGELFKQVFGTIGTVSSPLNPQ